MKNIINLYTYKEADYLKKIDNAIGYKKVELIDKFNQYRKFLGLKPVDVIINKKHTTL
jgi:hypothetical protein